MNRENGNQEADDDSGMINSLIVYLQASPQRTYVIKLVVVVSLVLVFQSIVGTSLFRLIFNPLSAFLLSLTLFCVLKVHALHKGVSIWRAMLDNLTIVPSVYTEGGWRDKEIAWVTYLLVLTNVFVFYAVQPALGRAYIGQNLLFLPRDPTWWNVPAGLFSTMFLHGSTSHLWGNMFFLWGAGAVLEKRLGAKRFFLLYLVTGIGASIAGSLGYLIFNSKVLHCLGASGAISGVLGLFAVRCYFKTMVIPLPILGFLPVSYKVRINSLVLIALFFFADLSSGIDVAQGVKFSQTAHWVHIGGMLTGLILGFRLRLDRSALSEYNVEVGNKALENNLYRNESLSHLEKEIAKDPANYPALQAKARILLDMGTEKEAIDAYNAVFPFHIKEDQADALEMYETINSRFKSIVEENVQFQIAGLYYTNGVKEKAFAALEALLQQGRLNATQLEKLLYQLTRISFELGDKDNFAYYADRFKELYPGSSRRPKIDLFLNKFVARKELSPEDRIKNKYEDELQRLIEKKTDQTVELYEKFHAEQNFSLRAPLQMRVADLLAKKGSLSLAINALQRLLLVPDLSRDLRRKILGRAATYSCESGNVEAEVYFKQELLACKEIADASLK